MILISGITGFIGKRLATGLVRAGFEVCGLSNKTDVLLIEGSEVPVVPISQKPLVDIFEMHNIEHVVNLAVDYGRDGSIAAKVFDTNCRLALDLYLLADHFGCRSFIQTGSFFEKQHDPTYASAYVRSKQTAHTLCQRLALKTPYIMLQLEHVYGPNDNDTKLLPYVLRRLVADDGTIEIGFCDLERDLIYVDDVVAAYLVVIENYQDCEGETIEVGKGCVVNLQSVVEKLAGMVKHYKPSISRELKFSGDSGGQLLSSRADPQILRKLGWEATASLNFGLDKMITDKLDGQF